MAATLLQPFIPQHWRRKVPKDDTKIDFEIYCDGSAYPISPGQLGIGAIVINRNLNSEEFEIKSGAGHGTADRAEMYAALVSLRFLSDPSRILLYSDSSYLVNGMRGWTQPNQNWDLWRELHHEAERHYVTWFKVRGHVKDSKNPIFLLNNRSHKLAYHAAKGG